MCQVRPLDERDIDLIMGFLLDKDMFAECMEDGVRQEPWMPDFRYWAYIGCFYDGVMRALTEVRTVTLSALELHFKSDKDLRGKEALRCARKTITFIFDRLNVNKLTCAAPEYRKNNQRFIAMCGFKREGVNRASFLKSGKYWDQVLYGLTRAEHGI